MRTFLSKVKDLLGYTSDDQIVSITEYAMEIDTMSIDEYVDELNRISTYLFPPYTDFKGGYTAQFLGYPIHLSLLTSGVVCYSDDFSVRIDSEEADNESVHNLVTMVIDYVISIALSHLHEWEEEVNNTIDAMAKG